jgi:hypothetical protein
LSPDAWEDRKALEPEGLDSMNLRDDWTVLRLKIRRLSHNILLSDEFFLATRLPNAGSVSLEEGKRARLWRYNGKVQELLERGWAGLAQDWRRLGEDLWLLGGPLQQGSYGLQMVDLRLKPG